VQLWHAAQLDIICIQETWAGRPGRGGRVHSAAELELWVRHAAAAVGAPAYVTYWGDNTSLPDENNGVAILVRPSPSLTTSAFAASPCGRLCTLRVHWAGHTFTLVNAYWPSTGMAQRHAFLAEVLAPALQLPSPCLAGDFNFTPAPHLDRRSCTVSTANADAATTALLAAQQHVPLVDAYRHHHPVARSFTFHRGEHMARLDRVLLPPALLPFSMSPSVLHTPHGDHHAVVVPLLPCQPLHPRGPGRRAIPSSLPTTSPSTESELASWARRAVQYGLTLSHQALLDWWPGMQREYASFARSLAAAACRRWLELVRSCIRPALQRRGRQLAGGGPAGFTLASARRPS
jgi:exonuclease III